jgi:DNA-binding transcriptional LysR family regulator
MLRPVNWDDLRIIAAVKDEGTFAGASARLRIDETTVARRLARIQRSLGFNLFDAVDGLRKATRQCEEVLAHIQAISRHVADIGKVGGDAPGPIGRFRIASTNGIAEEVLSPRAAEFLAKNPGLTLQFLVSNENVNFSRWEADFAIRLRKPNKGNFAISHLGDARLYFIEPAQTPESGIFACAYPPGLDLTPESRFLQGKGVQETARCVTDNLRVIRNLLLSQQAIGVLPEYMCGELLADARLRLTPLSSSRGIWLLIQDHLRRDRVARIVVDWMRDCFRGFRLR